jgi:hypothetical protein
MASYKDIDALLEPYGLCLRGGLLKGEETYLLVGNVGSKIWKRFGLQFDDWVEPNPLDHWTKKTVDALALKYGARAIYPFDGPKYPPFQEWARRADMVYPSPIGPLIHPEYGLWHAYRAALVFTGTITDIPKVPATDSPCDKCSSKPCLSSCPVDAFKDDSFNFAGCMDYLNENLEGTCMDKGCMARQACPVGKEYAYEREHGRFHMERFLKLKSS